MEYEAGQIIWVAFDWAPDGWLPCDGREIRGDLYPALKETLLGLPGNTREGKTYRLPDLRGRQVIGSIPRNHRVLGSVDEVPFQFRRSQAVDHFLADPARRRSVPEPMRINLPPYCVLNPIICVGGHFMHLMNPN